MTNQLKLQPQPQSMGTASQPSINQMNQMKPNNTQGSDKATMGM